MHRIDWEDFKAKTLELNRPRTKEERINVFKREANSSWKDMHHFHFVDESESRALPKLQPLRLEDIARMQIKKQLYLKAYVDLIIYITDGEGIYPKRWDQGARDLRSEVLRIRDLEGDQIYQEARELFHD